jgi:hypothetical protein
MAIGRWLSGSGKAWSYMSNFRECGCGWIANRNRNSSVYRQVGYLTMRIKLMQYRWWALIVWKCPGLGDRIDDGSGVTRWKPSTQSSECSWIFGCSLKYTPSEYSMVWGSKESNCAGTCRLPTWQSCVTFRNRYMPNWRAQAKAYEGERKAGW